MNRLILSATGVAAALILALVGFTSFNGGSRVGGPPGTDHTSERHGYSVFLPDGWTVEDRPGTLEQLRRVANTFAMPAYNLLVDGQQRAVAVQELHIFDEQMFLYEVFEPCLAAIGVQKSEIRQRRSRREQVVMSSTR